MKARGRKRFELIPKNRIVAALSSVHEYICYCQDVAVLPKVFYSALAFFFMCCASGPLLLAETSEIWGSNATIGNMIKVVSFAWRLGAIFTDKWGVTWASWVNFGLLILCYLPAYCLCPIYVGQGRSSKGMCIFVTFVNDFLLQIVLLWTPSQIGTLVGLAVRSEMNGIVPIVALAVLFPLTLVYLHIIVLPQVDFVKGRVLTWNGRTMTLFFVLVSVNLFLTRVIELVNIPVARIIMEILVIVIAILMVVLCSEFNWTIEVIPAAGLIGSVSAMLIAHPLLLVQLFGKDIEPGLVLILAILLLFTLSVLFFNELLKRRENSVLVHLDMLEFDNLSFEESFVSLRHFLLEMRIGFKHRHSYVLSFLPFKAAMEKWPSSSNLWMQYLRFLAVYSERTRELHAEAELFKNQKFRSLYVKSFRKVVRKCLNSRSRHMSRDLPDAFKILDEEIFSVKNLLARYWVAVEGCSRSMVYDLGKQISDKLSEIESFMNHLDGVYPNNIDVCRKRGDYYGDIWCDPVAREKFWKHAAAMENQNNIGVGLTQRAKEMFPHLPPRLAGIQRHIDRVDQADDNFDGGMDEADLIDSLDAAHETSPNIRELGLHASLPFLRNLECLLFWFLVIAIAGGGFGPAIFTHVDLNGLNNYFKGVDAACRLADGLKMTATYELAQLLMDMKVLHTTVLINLTTQEPISYYAVIDDTIAQINMNLNVFNQYTSTTMELNTVAGQALLQSSIELKVGDLTNTTIYKTYIVSLPQALASTIGSLGMYTPGDLTIFSDGRFRDGIANCFAVAQALVSLTYTMCTSIIDHLSRVSTIVTIIVSVFAIVDIVMMFFVVYMIYGIRTRWNNMVQVFGSMPHIALQKAVSKFKKEDKVLIKEEMKYSNVLEQLVSTRSLQHGLPISVLVVSFAVNAILAMVALPAMYFSIKGSMRPVAAIPFRMYYTADFAKNSFRSAQILMRAISVDSGSPFWYDTRDSLGLSLEQSLQRTIESLNNFAISEHADIETGVLGSTMETVGLLLGSTSEWMEETRKPRLQEIPRLVSIDVMAEVLTKCYGIFMTTTEDISGDDPDIRSYINWVLNYMFPTALDLVSASYAENADDTVNECKAVVYGIASCFSLVGCIMFVIIKLQIGAVRDTMRFCLSALSMIDFRFLRDSPCVMALLSGNYSVSLTENDTLMPFLVEADESTSDAIIILNDSLRVTWYNKVARESYGFDDHSVKNSHIRAVLRFSNKEILRTLEESVSYGKHQVKVQTEFESVVYYYSSEHGSEKEHEELIKVLSVPTKKKRDLALIMTRRDEVQTKLDEAKRIYQDIDALKRSVMPSLLNGTVGLDATVELRSIIVVAVDICNYQELTRGKTLADGDSILRQFQSIVDETASEMDDAIRLDDIGCCAFVCFNIIKQRTNMMDIASQALQFCRTVAGRCREVNMTLRAGMGYDSVCRSGLVSPDRLKFDVFGASGKQAFCLARKAGPFQAIPIKRICDFLPTEDLRGSFRLRVSLMWDPIEWYQVFNI